VADVRTVSLFLALLAVTFEVAVVVAVVLVVASRRSVRAAGVGGVLADAIAPSALWLAFAVATVATLGSLYYAGSACCPRRDGGSLRRIGRVGGSIGEGLLGVGPPGRIPAQMSIWVPVHRDVARAAAQRRSRQR
jgi:hypothetical protein